MSDLFISYSREDIAYARLLHNALIKHNLDTWIDWQDIPPSAEWLKEVYVAIEETNTFIFIVSASSVLSEICVLEIDHARKNNKRIIPLVIDNVEPSKVHPELATINWIFSRSKDELQPAIESLIEAIQTDYDWVKVHTRLQMRALEWENNNKDKSFLLRGADLEAAELWLSSIVDKEPLPTSLQTDYIIFSRQDSTIRQRRTTIGISFALITAMILATIAFFQSQMATNNFNISSTQESIAKNEANLRATEVVIREIAQAEAENQARVAQSRLLSTYSQSIIDQQLDVAMLLSIEAYRSDNNFQSRQSMLRVLTYDQFLTQFIQGLNSSVNTLAFSPDGNILAVGSEDGTIFLWNKKNGQLLGGPLNGHTLGVTSLVFSPDGKQLVSGGADMSIVIWDIEREQPKGVPLTGHTDYVYCLAFDPTGSLLVSGFWDGILALWDTSSGNLLDTVNAHELSVTDVEFSLNENIVASSSGDKTIKLWQIDNHKFKFLHFIKNKNWINSLAFNPKTNILASGNSDGFITFWDTLSSRPISEGIQVSSNPVEDLAYSPDGSKLAYAAGHVSLIDINKGEILGVSPTSIQTNASSIAFSPDGVSLAAGSVDGSIVLWNLGDDRTIANSIYTGTEHFTNFTYSPDGEILATGSTGGIVVLWNTNDMEAFGEPMFTGIPPAKGLSDTSTIEIPGIDVSTVWKNASAYSVVDSLLFSPEGNILIAGNGAGNFNLWDPSTQDLIGEPPIHASSGSAPATFSPDGSILVYSNFGGTLHFLDISTGIIVNRLKDAHSGMIESLAFNPIGNTVASGGDFTIKLWDIETYKNIASTTVREKNPTNVDNLVFSSDGELLFSDGSFGAIVIHDANTLQHIGEMASLDSSEVIRLALSYDNRLLAAGYKNGIVILWDLENRQPLGKLLIKANTPIYGLAFKPESKTLAVSNEAGSFLLWNLDEAFWYETLCQTVGRNFSKPEWTLYFPDQPYRLTCPQWSEGSDEVQELAEPISSATPNASFDASDIESIEENSIPEVQPTPFIYLFEEVHDINSDIFMNICNWPREDEQVRITLERPDGMQSDVLNIGGLALYPCGEGILPGFQMWFKPLPEEGELPGIWKFTFDGLQTGARVTKEVEVR